MKKIVVGMVMLLVMVTSVVAPAMAKGENADDPSIQLRFLIQPQMQIGQAKKGDGGTWTPDDNGLGQEFYLRRTRVILAGKVNKWIHFFFETDNPNMGRNGGFGNTFTQDGFIDFRFFDEFKVAMGMILLPFSRHNRQSAASLMGLDYHAAVFAGWQGANIWRDYGIEARGIVAKKIDYRVGVFRGFRGAVATNDVPRITGRVAYNFFDVESKFFYGGTYLGQSKHLSLGFGFDVQPEGGVNGKGKKDPYYALTGDVFVDWPLGNKMAITANGGFMFYSWGPKKLNPTTSLAGFGEVGFLIHNFQPVFGFELGNPLDTKTFKDVEFQNFRLGLNYFIKGHNATVKVEYAINAASAMGQKIDNRRRNVITLQTQLLF